MARKPKLVLDEEAIEIILSAPSKARRRLFKVLNELRNEQPRATEDFFEGDETGRHISIKAARPFMIHYWLDGAVDEFRVVRIIEVKPWIY